MTNGARRVGDHPVIRQGPTGDAFPGAKYDYAKQDGAMTDRVAPEKEEVPCEGCGVSIAAPRWFCGRCAKDRREGGKP